MNLSILYKLKHFLLILATCATIIEMLPSISFIIGLLYIGVSFIDNYIINRKKIYKSDYYKICNLWLLLFVLLTIITILNPSTRLVLSIIDLKWFRAILFFIFVYRDTINNIALQKDLCFFYGLSALLSALLMYWGIGAEFNMTSYEIGEVRMTFFGTNANKLAMTFSYAIVFFLHFYEKGWRIHINTVHRAFIAFLSILFLIYSISITGSRGGLISISFVIIYYFIIYKHSKRMFYNILVLIIFITLFYWGYDYISNIEIVANRFAEMSSGNMGLRDVLFLIGIEIFIDNPFIGIGMNCVPEYIYNKIGLYLTTHNLFIYILASGGIVCFSIFGYILFKIYKTIYIKSLKNRRLLIPISLLILSQLDWMKNGGALSNNINYIMLALAYSIADSENNLENTQI